MSRGSQEMGNSWQDGKKGLLVTLKQVGQDFSVFGACGSWRVLVKEEETWGSMAEELDPIFWTTRELALEQDSDLLATACE